MASWNPSVSKPERITMETPEMTIEIGGMPAMSVRRAHGAGVRRSQGSGIPFVWRGTRTQDIIDADERRHDEHGEPEARANGEFGVGHFQLCERGPESIGYCVVRHAALVGKSLLGFVDTRLRVEGFAASFEYMAQRTCGRGRLDSRRGIPVQPYTIFRNVQSGRSN